MFNINELIKQAQKMQEDLKKVEEDLNSLKVEGESGGGMVKAVVSGKKDLISIWFDPSILKDEKDIIEDLILAAVKNAQKLADLKADEKMKSIKSHLPPIPGIGF